MMPHGCTVPAQIALAILTVALTACAATPATSQAESFPDSWVGTWHGRCTYFPADRNAKPREFAMELVIGPTADPARYTWTVIYIEGDQRQERPYELVIIDAAAGKFVIDEKNSIMLDSRFIDGALYSQFVVGTSVITASYRRDGERLVVELLTTDVKGAAVTGAKDVPEVQTHPVKGLQRAVLEHAPTR